MLPRLLLCSLYSLLISLLTRFLQINIQPAILFSKGKEMEDRSDLKDLGYDAFFESSLDPSRPELTPARVIAEHRASYKVTGKTGELTAKITGRLQFQASAREDYPAVGDWVAITEVDKKTAIIETTLPRKTLLKRKYSDKQEIQVIAANLDKAFIVEAVDRDYNLNRLERYLVLARDAEISAAVVLNKTDLISFDELDLKIRQLRERFPDTPVLTTSTKTETGIAGLADSIQPGKTYCFLGSSGAGKSSLINRLLGDDRIRTKEISLASGRGKHTTTTRQLYILKSGGIVIDNPGIREVGIADAALGVQDVFDEIADTAQRCRYSDCTHTHEPGCAVREAVRDKKIDEQKLTHYGKLKKETEYYTMTDYEKRKKDRKFGKHIKKILKQMKDKGL